MDKNKNLKEDVLEQEKDLNDRINKLYGSSAKEIKKSEMSNEEKQKIRKQMWFLLLLSSTTMILALIILLNPFGRKSNDQQINNNHNEHDELTIGEIDVKHKIVQHLRNRIEFSVLDLYYVDVFQYFNNDIVDFNAIDDQLKVHLIKKNDLFVDLLVEKGLLEYVETCDETGIDILKDEFDKIVEQTLGENIKISNDFSTTLNYMELEKNPNLLFSKVGDSYSINCNGKTLDADLTKYPHQALNNAIVIEGGIELYYNVVFIDGEKVYKDYNYEELIAESKDVDYDSYIQKGSYYKYTFMKNKENNYYLSKIEIIK